MRRVYIKKKLKGLNIDVNFSFEQLRCVIFGPSGSGKSSILKMVAGFFEPEEGLIELENRVFFSSKDKINIPINKRNIGYLPQEYTLFPHMNVEENILYGIKVRKIELDKNLFNFLIKITNMEDYLKAYPSQISGGQQQRAALLRAIIVKPKLLLLDEPFSALDKPIREELRDLVIDLSDKFHIPVLFVTHDIDEAFTFANEIVLIKNGKMIQAGLKDDVFENPANIDSAKLLNFKNIWNIEGVDGGKIKVNKKWIDAYISKEDNPSYCCIKPENVLILRDDTDISDKENKIYGNIKSIHRRSDYFTLNFNGEGFEILIKTPPHVIKKMKLSKGDNITVSLKKESLVLIK